MFDMYDNDDECFLHKYSDSGLFLLGLVVGRSDRRNCVRVKRLAALLLNLQTE